MQIVERTSGDSHRLRALARKEQDATQRDRYLAAAHAIAQWETLDIAEALGRSRRSVQRWVYAYRDGGIEALRSKPRGGSEAKLGAEHFARLKARLGAGPRESDKVCTLRGKDVQRIAREEFDVAVSLSSVYRSLHAMGYSCLSPRPRHEKQDLEAQRKFREESAPLLSAPSRTPSSRSAAGLASSSWTRRGSGSRAR